MARDLTFKLILDSLGFQRGAKGASDALSKLSKDVKATSSEMKPLGAQMDWASGILAKMSSPLGMATMGITALGAGAAIAAKGVADLAKEAEKLQLASAKTGIGLQALQQYQRTALNMNMSLEQVTGAINKMQRGMETNTKAMAAAGLELQKIKSLAPENQFEAIARQIAAMESPSQRTAAAMAAFGRSGAELLPMLIKVGTEGTDAIVTMSNSQIEALGNVDNALDDFAGAWKDLQNQLFAGFAQLGGNQGIGILADGFRGLAQYMKEMSASSFFQDLATGNLLKNMVDAGNRAKLYQGAPVNNAAAGVFQPSTDLGLMDPMAALALMEREQIPAMKRLGELDKDRIRYNKELSNIKSLQTDKLIEEIAAMESTLPTRKLYAESLNSLMEPFGKKDTPLAGNWDFSKFDNEATRTNETVEKIKESTIDWAQELQNAANILSSMGGTLGEIGQTMAQVSAGIAGIQSGKATFSAGMEKGGLGGALGMLSGGLSIVSSAIGIGKAIVGLFKGDPVQKAAKEAGKAIGMKVSKEMANSFFEESKKTGKSVAQVAKEWMDGMRKELRTQGMGQMAEGVNTMMSLLGTSPEITRIAAGNFATLFWETVKDEGWVAASAAFADTFGKLKEFYGENMPASLQSIQGLMNLSQNSAVSPYLQAAQAQGQFVTGAMNAGIYSQGMQGDSTVIAKETIGQLKSNGATDEQAYQAIGSLLQANVNAALASGRGISSDLQALLDEARANGVDIVADINVQQLEVLRAIYSVLGGIGSPGSTSGASAPSSVPAGGGSDFSPTGDPIVPERIDWKNGAPDMPAYADGGIVTRPTVALVGEAGPEAIVPLRRGGGGGGGSHVTLSPTLVVDPLLSHEGRKDLVKFLLAEMDKGTRNNPYMNRMIRRGAVGGR